MRQSSERQTFEAGTAEAAYQGAEADVAQRVPDAFGYFGPPLMSVLAYSHGETSYPHPT